MSDNGPPAPGTQLPPPPTTAGAPGYDNQNGMGNPHMPPPPLPPVIIPQNTNPIPTAITSPMTGENGVIMSPDSQGGFVRRAAPEPNKRALYVGGLDPRVTEDVLRQIFETTGHVQNVKIIPDKNVGAVSINFISVKLLEILALHAHFLCNMQTLIGLPLLTLPSLFCHLLFSMLIALTSFSRRDSTTDLLNTMIPEQPSALCRP